MVRSYISTGIAISAWLATGPAFCQTLRIATAAETYSADPHHYATGPNYTLRDNLYQGLTKLDAKGVVTPALAQSWTRSDDLTWRFRLASGVRFSDGSEFGAPDVIGTFCRIVNNKEELSNTYSRIVRRLAAVTDDAGTLVIKTVAPEPLLETDLASLAIIPRSLAPAGVVFDGSTACGVSTGWPALADFNSGRAAIGTGPFQQVQYSRGGTIIMRRNEHFAGVRPEWSEVKLTPILQAGPRVAALLAGDQDLIETPGTADLPRLRDDKRFTVTMTPSLRLLFLQMDVARDPSPFLPGANALRDVRVRQALSLAINREALVAKILDGTGIAASQFLPPGLPSTIPDLPVLPFDPVRARVLLQEAGYPKGFTVTLHAPNDRYVNDGPLAQAIAQQWKRIGVTAVVETLPAVNFFTRRSRKEFSVAMGGWGMDADGPVPFFRYFLATPNDARSLGSANHGGWSDAAFDAVVGTAIVTMDTVKRYELQRRAIARALTEMPIIPLHFESGLWAMRAGIRYAGRQDQTTLAADIVAA